jgi:prevent-host-death family protein
VKTINVHQAKTELSKLLAQVERGGVVVIARAGKPVAKLVSIGRKTVRAPGQLPGLKLDKSFWDPLSENELSRWEK